MDIRVSKQGVEDFDELIDVQVTSPFCADAAGKEGKAAANAETKKRTKHRPAVVTPAIVETHGREPSSPGLHQRTCKRAPSGSKTP